MAGVFELRRTVHRMAQAAEIPDLYAGPLANCRRPDGAAAADSAARVARRVGTYAANKDETSLTTSPSGSDALSVPLLNGAQKDMPQLSQVAGLLRPTKTKCDAQKGVTTMYNETTKSQTKPSVDWEAVRASH